MGRRVQRACGLGVHALTASGVAWALLALDAVAANRVRDALVFMFVAVVVDGVDGTLARLVRVREVVPWVDGELLDNVVDFLNYTIVPAFLIDRSGLLPEPLSLPVVIAIGVASVFQFTHGDAKSSERGFRGFPSYWNVVAFYLLILNLSPRINLAIVLGLIALSLAPVYFVYPTRTVRWRGLTLGLTVTWGLSLAVMLGLYPAVPRWIAWSSLAYVAYYFGLSVLAFPIANVRLRD